MVGLLADPDTCALVVTSLSALSVLFWTVEHLSHGRMFRDELLYGSEGFEGRWRILARHDLLARSLNGVLRFPAPLVILACRAAAALLLVASPWIEGGQLVGTGVIYLSNVLLLNLWLPVRRGSDGMMSIVFGALFLRQLAGGAPIVTLACLWFIALQVGLSYSGCGAAKLAVPAWRKGHAVFIVANHRLFGSAALARLLDSHRWLSSLLTRMTVIMECAFPLALVVGYPMCWFFLGWGVAFHGFNAVAFGLNSFFWVYLATYPAIIYCALSVNAFLYA